MFLIIRYPTGQQYLRWATELLEAGGESVHARSTLLGSIVSLFFALCYFISPCAAVHASYCSANVIKVKGSPLSSEFWSTTSRPPLSRTLSLHVIGKRKRRPSYECDVTNGISSLSDTTTCDLVDNRVSNIDFEGIGPVSDGNWRSQYFSIDNGGHVTGLTSGDRERNPS